MTKEEKKMLEDKMQEVNQSYKNMVSNASVNGGIGWCSLLGIGFIILKLVGVISWPWLWVLAPFWIPVVICIILVLLLLAVLFWTKNNLKKIGIDMDLSPTDITFNTDEFEKKQQEKESKTEGEKKEDNTTKKSRRHKKKNNNGGTNVESSNRN